MNDLASRPSRTSPLLPRRARRPERHAEGHPAHAKDQRLAPQFLLPSRKPHWYKLKGANANLCNEVLAVEFAEIILKGLATGAATFAGTGLATYLYVKIKDFVSKLTAPEIQELLKDLGTTTPDHMRDLVQNTLGKDKNITNAQREELAVLLGNLARGARLITSQGKPRSSYLRCAGLIEKLLSKIQPLRKAGEKVGVGHDWTLTQFLGMGSFGEVWLAHHPKAQKLGPRAYKFFTQEGASDWLAQEKDVLLDIKIKLGNQPQIVRLEEVAFEGRPHPFLVLEYVGGGSLEDWIVEDKDHRAELHKHDIVRGMAQALAKAHQKGIFHRDLKPANILLTEAPDVQAKIGDFGLGTVKQAGATGSVLGSQTAWQVGTPMYWPPEAQDPFVHRGQDFEAQADVFALGVIWYQLLVEKLERPSYDFATELRDNGEDSHTIKLISRCLAHPSRRFKNAGELADQMDHVNLPEWNPPPEGLLNVSGLVREYLATTAN